MQLNLPPFDFTIRSSGQNKEIFDIFRKKYVVLTPEEWVRQHFAVFLRDHLKYPMGLIALEVGLNLNGLSNRADIVVYGRNGNPWMIVECKSPEVKLNQDVFYQASRYHSGLGAEYIATTNGLMHFCCAFQSEGFEFVKAFPTYPSS
ncbi:MAG: type I restriction enzyme HsdR N-terminal domain-containing protein [Bacteroidota bacterium]|jgi:hypothetical protein